MEPSPTSSFSTSSTAFKTVEINELTYGKLLGTGSYGIVYKGEWSPKNEVVKEVAIKQLHLKKMPEEMLKVFKREVEIMASCNFPNIMKLFGVCLNNDHYAMVMEYMPLGSLLDVLKDSNQELPWNPIRWELTDGIAKGLAYLHSEKIVHGDLKSPNILVANGFQAKISDFGLSQTKFTMSTMSQTVRSAQGTTRWMAPELFTQGQSSSFKSDVYALGMVMVEIANRNIPFHGQSNEQTIIHWIKSNDKPEIQADCPNEYRELLTDCLDFAPLDRPTAESLSKELVGAFEKYKRKMSKADQTQTISTINTFPSTNANNTLSTLQIRSGKESADSNSSKQSSLAISSSILSSRSETTSLNNYQMGNDLFEKCQFLKALPYLKKAAEEGHPPAYLKLMWLYDEDGRIGPKNTPESENWGRKAAANIDWFKKEAETKKADAQNDLAICYEVGLGVKKDPVEAFLLYSDAAGQNYTLAFINLAICYYHGKGTKEKNHQLAAIFLDEAAKQNNAMAQYLLGVCYAEGHGVKKDLKTAAEYYQKSADQDYAEAQNNLAACYKKGEGVTKNEENAFYWCKKAADQGDANAQLNLAKCYEEGIGTVISLESAFLYYEKAANQNLLIANEYLGHYYANGKGVAKDLNVSFKFYLKAANAGLPGAQYHMGFFYSTGIGVKEDKNQAFQWFQKAAEQGDIEAQYEIGCCYRYGKGVPINKEKAKEWLKKAKEKGHKKAASILFQMDSIFGNIGMYDMARDDYPFKF